jgi:hypothetical protein
MEAMITKAAQMIAFGASTDEIRAALLETGASEVDVYLAVMAARILARG